MQIKFRTKALLAIAIITLFSSLVISAALLKRTEQIIEEDYIHSIWNSASVSMGTFEESAHQAYNLAVRLSHDKRLAELINAHKEHPYDLQAALAISSYMGGLYPDDSAIEVVYLYLPYSEQLITSVEHNVLREIFYPWEHPWLTQWQKGRNTDLAPEVVFDKIRRVPKSTLAYTRPMYEAAAAEPPLISVLLDERRLFYQCLLGIGSNNTDNYYLVNQDGLIASSETTGQIGSHVFEIIEQSAALLTLPGKENVLRTPDNLLISLHSYMTGYSIVGNTSRAGLTALLSNQQRFIYLLLFVVLVVMLIPAYWASIRINRPIKLLQQAMEKVTGGDLSARASVITKDEIGQLSEGFNVMISRIETLIDEVVEERTSKKQAELEALQYQITPHFMYNTLNTIKYAALLHGAESVGEQIGAFIELLQASISRRGAFITVEDEVKLVRNYVMLQGFRYMDKFDIEFNVGAEVFKYYVPRLILQPLVENAIMHGEPDAQNRNKITVSASANGSEVLLSVQDNGRGMSPEQIDRIMSGKYKVRGYFSGIGVSNIIERLRMYYGENAGICFESVPERGVNVTIRLPASDNPDEYAI